MIPALLIWLYNRYAAAASKKRAERMQSANFHKVTNGGTALLLFLFCFSFTVNAQEKRYTYHVLHNGNVIGEMLFHQKTEGQDTFLKMSSQVKTRFVFGIEVNTVDQSRFRNGKLLFSNVYRNVNGKEKESKKTTWLDPHYQMQSGSKTGTISVPIHYNMMLLYCREPNNIAEVYSDNFQKFLPIQKIDTHAYRIQLPDGNHNDYYFQNGICKSVVVHHSLYTIKMELV
jgi:hypothetical protein